MKTLNDLYLSRPDLKERIEEIRRELGREEAVEESTIGVVLMAAFEFADTEEGFDYWWGLAESLDT